MQIVDQVFGAVISSTKPGCGSGCTLVSTLVDTASIRHPVICCTFFSSGRAVYKTADRCSVWQMTKSGGRKI